MKRACFVCLFLYLTTTFLLSQSNPVPLIHQSTSVVAPISASQADPKAQLRAQARSESLFARGPRAGVGLPHDKVPLAEQQANPLFSYLLEYDSGGCWASSVALKDVNGDGKLDLLVANEFAPSAVFHCYQAGTTNGSIGVLLGNGDGTFQAAVTYSSGGLYADSVAVADVNGDGNPDLLVANYCADSSCVNGNVGVLLGSGDGTFQATVTYSSGGLYANSVAAADVNGDGKPDLVVASGDGTVGVLLGSGDGTLQAAVTYSSGGDGGAEGVHGVGGAYSVAAADVNRDGNPDLLVANYCADSSCVNGNVGVLLGNGDGTFQAAVTYSSGGLYADSVAVADVNGDGNTDLLVANSCAFNQELCAQGSAGALLGNGDGTFQSAVSYLSPGQLALSLLVGDVNQDGKPDLLLYNSSFYTYGDYEGLVNLLLGNGDATFQASTSYLFGGNPYSQNPHGEALALGDVNGDGNPDLLVTSTCYGYPGTGPCQQGTADGSVGVFLNVSPSPTSTTLSSSVNPAAFGQPVTLYVAVTTRGSSIPTGNVTLSDGSTSLGTSSLSGGTASLQTATLPVGLNTINAVYSGDANFSSSSASLNQTVNQASTRLALTSSVNPSGLDSPVTFTATIVPQYGGQASGTVTFKDGSTTLGSAAVIGNAASLTPSGLAIGAHSITAVYSGDSNFTGSTANTFSQVVTKATTTTLLVSSMNPSVSGKPVTFTALVSSPAGTPTGKIKYLNGTAVLATLTLTSGSAKYTTAKLPPGADSITAVYQGDSNNSGSTSAPVNQFVLAATMTTLSSAPNPSAYGQAVVLTATVTSSIGVPPDGETVTFKKGTTVLGTGALSGGSASFTTSTFKAGTTAVKVVYGGDSNFAGSTSKAVSQVVSKATTKTALASSLNPSKVGQSVTFTVSVTPQFSGTPTGSIVFKDGPTTLKTVSLNGGEAKFTTMKLASCRHIITATYNGSTSFTGSLASLTQTVN